MRLVSLKQSRIPNRVFIGFSNRTVLPFNLDDVVGAGLAKGQEISDQQYAKLISLSFNYLLYSYALYQISLSAKNETIIIRKIKTKLFFYLKKYAIDKNLLPSDLITNVITKIKSQGLLNESDYIKSYINKHSRKSRREIEYYLRAQGVDPKNIDPSLFSDNSELDKIKKLIIKKIKSPQDLSDIKTKNKLLAYLFRKGFSVSLVKVAIDEYLSSQ